MSDATTYTGSCFCGAVTLEVTGAPEGAGYCHCTTCRGWSKGPMNAFTLWKAEAVTVTQGEDRLAEYGEHDNTFRQWCTACGGAVMARHPQWGLVDVFAATIPDFPFTPGVHVNYESTVLRVPDGLPKFKDFPAEMGGSGDLLPE